MKYRPEIDGLRAFAIIPVVFYHAGISFISGGFVGVDVFFVISGYLITTILIEDFENNRFSILTFYERRARRLLPALILMLLLVSIVSWLILLPDDMREVYQQIVSNSFFLSNIHYTLTWDYFESWKLPPVLLNTWSLAVEEQFYLFMPVILLLLQHKAKSIVLTFSILALISILFMVWMASVSVKANYYLLPSRFWELSAGVLIAYFIKFKPDLIMSLRDNTSAWIHIMMFFTLLTTFFTFTEQTPYPSLWTLVPVTLTAFMLLLADTRSPISAILTNKYLIYIGKISYPLYLIHFPVIIFLRTTLEPLFQQWQVTVLSLVLTIFLSALTYHYVEQPIRKKKILKSRRHVFNIVTFSAILFSSLGLSGHFKFLESYSLQRFPELAHLTEIPPMPEKISLSDCVARNASTHCQLLLDINKSDSSHKFLIIGDSFGADLISPLWQLFRGQPNFSLSARATYGCSYMPGTFSVWDGECAKARAKMDELTLDDASDLIFHIDFIGHLRDQNKLAELNSLTRSFQALTSKGIQVHVFGAREVFNIEPARAKLYPWLFSALEMYRAGDVLKEFYSKWTSTGIRVYEQEDDLNKADAYKFYRDGGHLSYYGGANFIARLGIDHRSYFLEAF